MYTINKHDNKLHSPKINGFMIDCCRILEKKDYYYNLIDFLADWNITHLQLHFSDNHGCAINIPGFSDIAMPHAFSPKEITALCSYARSKNIDIIPELETFGHTQYLTDNSKYSHLFAGYQKEPGGQKGGGVNPLLADSLSIMQRLIDEVIKMFPGRYLHIGCDEVNMDDFLADRNLCEEEVWADYVNELIDYVRKCGKIPIIWGDQLKKKPETIGRLRKDVVLMEWDYEAVGTDKAVALLINSGFEKIITSPSVIFCRYRFFPTKTAFKNIRRTVGYAAKYGLEGVMNTAWCPHRYLSSTLYYAIAYNAYLTENGGRIKIREFRNRFARYMFDKDCDYALERFLHIWPKLNISGDIAKKLIGEIDGITKEEERLLEFINLEGIKALKYAGRFEPSINHDVWNAMKLSARAAWICSESYFAHKTGAKRLAAFSKKLKDVIVAVEQEWDKTRYSDDEHKYVPHFNEPLSSYMIPLLNKLYEDCL